MEEGFLIYILKCSGLTAIFILVYLLLLKNDTSFGANRKFLLGGIMASFVLPLIEFTRTVIIENPSLTGDFAVSEGVAEFAAQPATALDLWFIAGVFYLVGVSFLGARFILQLLSVRKHIKGEPKKRIGKLIFVTTTKEVQPFSFFNYIVYNPELHSAAELEIVLEHEKIHAHQWHSVDVILVNLSTIFLWCNPFIWIYKKHLIQNLEFLADRGGMENSVSRKAYQQTLLKISLANFQPALSNSFYQSFIKKRIMMLNKKSKQKFPFWKMSTVVPFLIVFMFFLQVETEAQVVSNYPISEEKLEENDKISATITEFSTPESLQKIEKLFEKAGAEIQFRNTEYSSEGKLVALDINFERESFNQTGNSSLNNSQGIPSTTIISTKEGFSITTSDKSSSNTSFNHDGVQVGKGQNSTISYNSDDINASQWDENSSSVTVVQQSPLYVLNGKIQKKDFNIDSVDPEEIAHINVLKGASATEKYGEKGENGVIEITLKSENETGVGVKESEEKNFTFSAKQIVFDEDSEGEGVTIQLNGVSSTGNFNLENSEALIVINGEVQKKDYDFGQIKSEEIESITVLKGENATEKYGEKASKGAIEITLKD